MGLNRQFAVSLSLSIPLSISISISLSLSLSLSLSPVSQGPQEGFKLVSTLDGGGMTLDSQEALLFQASIQAVIGS